MDLTVVSEKDIHKINALKIYSPKFSVLKPPRNEKTKR